MGTKKKEIIYYYCKTCTIASCPGIGDKHSFTRLNRLFDCVSQNWRRQAKNDGRILMSDSSLSY